MTVPGNAAIYRHRILTFQDKTRIDIPVSDTVTDGDIRSIADVVSFFGIAVHRAVDDQMIGPAGFEAVSFMDTDAVILDGVIGCATSDHAVSDRIIGAISINISVIAIVDCTILYEIAIDGHNDDSHIARVVHITVGDADFVLPAVGFVERDPIASRVVDLEVIHGNIPVAVAALNGTRAELGATGSVGPEGYRIPGRALAVDA